jgi:hypothetical protein
MTVDEVEDRIVRLRAIEQVDKQAAAAGADMLRVEVLAAIRDGAENAMRLAHAVLETVSQAIGECDL